LLGDLGVNFPGLLISRGFGHGFGLFGLAKTFLGSRYHADPPGKAQPTLTEPFTQELAPAILGVRGEWPGPVGSPISPSSDGENDNAAARNSFLRQFEIDGIADARAGVSISLQNRR
jgi:hypothetical protein